MDKNKDQNNRLREDKPRNINPDETGVAPPGKELLSQEKIEIKESGSGREQSQIPAEENIGDNISQIDRETARMRSADTTESKPGSEELLLEEDPERGYRNEINSSDRRDPADSTKDWDAEKNESGRHK